MDELAFTQAEKRLYRITKLQNKDVLLMREGVSLEADLSRPLSETMAQTVADRLDLADEFLSMAQALMRSRTDLSRAAIARFYYAMYHAMRAAAYQHFKGDDHEAHSTLSSKGVPPDYPLQSVASNELKDARILRNEADYDQYPLNGSYFRVQAKSLQPIATAFVQSARLYVTSKGNPYS
jgi:uncharacterized protein (UPF0332 family)